MQFRSGMTQFAKFGLVGLSSTGLYFLLLLVFERRIGSLPLLTAVCYGISMGYNYLLQSRFTFWREEADKGSIGRFISMHLGALAFNSAAMTGLVEGLGAPLIPAQVVVTGIIAISTFLISKHWVYRGDHCGKKTAAPQQSPG